MWKKGLVAGIIVLFIGVGIQPAIADVSNTSIFFIYKFYIGGIDES